MNYLAYFDTPRTKLQELMDDYCDLHKSVHGIKARWIYGAGYSEAQMEDMLARLQRDAEEVWKQEAAREAIADAAFITAINKMVELGAGDHKTALKWLHDAHDTGGNNTYLGFDFGCSYQFVETFFKGLN
jgi:hypothetical protein